MSRSSNEPLAEVRFNQRFECFTCCFPDGLSVYDIEPLAEKAFLRQDLVGTIAFAEMLHRTNLVAIVAGGRYPKYSDNTILIWDDKVKDFVLEFTFPSRVLNVRLRRDKLIAVLLNSIQIFSFPNDPQKLFVLDTSKNPRALCQLSASSDRQLLCFPGNKTGSVHVHDISNEGQRRSSAPGMIPAHQHELACMALNHDSSLLATASVQGTLIRVFDVASRKQLLELRRGSDSALVYCMNFSADSEYLCASSDKGTVHVFAIKAPQHNRRLAIPTGGLLGPYADSQWGLASFTVPVECPCICAFGKERTIYAVCVDGTFHKYSFTTDGSCVREGFQYFLELHQQLLL